ncbi:Rieske (2Fe-2S) protein [Prescottella agglutinans]|uniref:Cytochrome bc1 complex Rieske iron-sulfur subunit n=1 Tax=Prescottella agglutinans TaxID=1644129 RepID=A0A3S3AHZ4_9NOCA|nr:Rieske (2Fe-2S) protein [Prescottella agglutinans]RVW08639.1 Rieske (2Fe-2S) protein [Prescottella agglutinans]
MKSVSDTRTEVPRRAFLITACAACGLAATACSSGTSGGDASTTISDPIEVPASDVPLGGGIVLTASKVVVTQPESGVFKAFSAVCTHQGCLVMGVRDGAVECPCHNSRFSAADGSVVRGPARQPLQPRTVTASAGTLTIT